MTPSELKALQHRILVDFNQVNEAARKTKCADLARVAIHLGEVYKTVTLLRTRTEEDA